MKQNLLTVLLHFSKWSQVCIAVEQPCELKYQFLVFLHCSKDILKLKMALTIDSTYLVITITAQKNV